MVIGGTESCFVLFSCVRSSSAVRPLPLDYHSLAPLLVFPPFSFPHPLRRDWSLAPPLPALRPHSFTIEAASCYHHAVFFVVQGECVQGQPSWPHPQTYLASEGRECLCALPVLTSVFFAPFPVCYSSMLDLGLPCFASTVPFCPTSHLSLAFPPSLSSRTLPGSYPLIYASPPRFPSFQPSGMFASLPSEVYS